MDTAVRLAALAAAMSGPEIADIVSDLANAADLEPAERAVVDEAIFRLRQTHPDRAVPAQRYGERA